MKKISAIFCFFCIVFMANAQSPVYDFLDINKVSARINNSGNHFWDQQGQAHYKVPKALDASALFCFSLWIGGVDADDSLHLAADRYSGSGRDYWPGPLSDSAYYTPAYDSAWNYVWKINKSEIDYHRNHYWVSGYVAPDVILNWPGNGDPAKGQAAKLAPFSDQNNNGAYEPMLGDYPLIKGDQAVFFIMNDKRKPHTETNGRPLGVEIHAMAYAFNCPDDSALIYTTFMNYNVYNRSAVRYDETFIGAFVDTDLGNAWDDYVGCDVSRGSFYTYNADTFDGFNGNVMPDEYGEFPPAISVTVLGGPFLDPDNLDNPKFDSQGNSLCDVSINGDNFGDQLIDNERYGLSNFFYIANCASGPTCDPAVAADYYNLLNGKWKDGTPMQYGGNGHPNAGATGGNCHFMFPGLSDSCNWGTGGLQPPGYATGAGGSGTIWTEPNVGNPPGDRRGVISMGPFTFQPGSFQEVHLAFVWARQYTDSSALASVSLLKTRIDQVRLAYENDSVSCGGSFSGIPSPIVTASSISIFPNPASDVLNVDYEGSAVQIDFVIVNILGETLLHGKLHNNGLNTFSVGELPAGLYLLLVRDRGVVTGKRFLVR